MATKRDLVEAYQFSRRRLVTAFVSGAPGGREVEPARPGRTIVGGLALAVLMIAGAAIAGIFAPRDPAGWEEEGLIVSKETGAAYVITEESSPPILRPVINITSAKLILGTGEPAVISQETIDEQEIGDALGILDAPADLPSPGLLIDEGWTACSRDVGTADSSGPPGIRLNVSEDVEVQEAARHGFVVRSHASQRYYVIAQARQEGDETPRAYRYPLPEVRAKKDQLDNMLLALGLPNRAGATVVSEEWLDLFPGGGALEFAGFELEGVGRPGGDSGATGLPDGADIGDIVTSPTGSYLLTLDGAAPLDAFALEVYRRATTPQGRPPNELDIEAAPGGVQASPPYAAARWPDTVLSDVPGEHCAVLVPQDEGVPNVRVAEAPVGEAAAVDVTDGQVSVRVDPGRGAYVLSGSFDDTTDGSPFVVDAKGRTYPLVGPGAADLLGYGSHDVRVVPDPWVELFKPGVPLSQALALCPPERKAGETCG